MDLRQNFDQSIQKISSKFYDQKTSSNKLHKFFNEIEHCIKQLEETEDVPVLDGLFVDTKKTAHAKKASKENQSNDILKTKSFKTSRRAVLRKIEENVKASILKNDVVVKLERLPFDQPAKRGRNKKAVDVKKEAIVILEKIRDSDVIILKPSIDTVDLTANNEVANPNDEFGTISEPRKTDTRKRSKGCVQTETRITRTNQKRQEHEEKESWERASVYEDALSSPPKIINALSGDASTASSNIHLSSKGKVFTPSTEDMHTKPITEMIKAPVNQTIITKTAPPILNETITIQKAHTLNETIILHKDPASSNGFTIKENILMDNLMTDDESIELEPKPKKKIVLKQNSKQIFSPYGLSPVKKRVEAFEKLANTPPTMRVTRTKTRKLNEAETPSNQKLVKLTQKSAKPKTSSATATNSVIGFSNRFNLRATPGTQKKTNRFINTGDNISSKTLSAYKASQEEFREREKQRREREAEALQKKDALRQAQIEEKKRKREEKEQKAKEQREALELAEKQKALELQRQKEEKHKMNLLEKQEKLQKSKEEAEKKRLLIKQKREEKKRERDEKSKPIYMTQKAPHLPTFDCYDSNDDEAPDTKQLRPDWTSREKIHEKLKTKRFIAPSYVNTFFCCQPHSPDLQEIFENIDPEKLVRKSSAVWNHQPRFTCMPNVKRPK